MAYNKRQSEPAHWYGQSQINYPLQPKQQVTAPPLSQIPGLSRGTNDGPPEPQKQWLKDTDSEYVRLAKQGGRADLLRQDDNDDRSDEKIPNYPRPDWLGPDDDNDEGTLRKEDYEFESNGPAMYRPYGDDYSQAGDVDQQYGRKNSGYNLPQKPFAVDDRYQYPMTTETGSAYADDRGNYSQVADDYDIRYQSPNVKPQIQQNNNNNNARYLSPTVVTPQQNRMKQSESMSKLLSFGYLKDSEKDEGKRNGKGGYATDAYTTEYKAKMAKGSDSNGLRQSEFHQQQSPAIPSSASSFGLDSAGFRRRKQSFDDRPDFFKIGSTPSGPTSSDLSLESVGYGRRKTSAETRPDIFGRSKGLAAVNVPQVPYGKKRGDLETRPDFFKIGSLDNLAPRNERSPAKDEPDFLDKLNKYHGMTQQVNYRRRKMDQDGPMLTTPVKAGSRF